MQSDVSGHDHRFSSRLMMLDYAVTVSDHLKLKTGSQMVCSLEGP